MEMFQKCSECGAALKSGQTCQDHFHQMLFWEADHPDYGRAVHHLMVLSYHLQHPSLYSPEGLVESRNLLTQFVEHGASPAEILKRNRDRLDSGSRKWKIKGTPASRGSYARPVQWTMTAVDVMAGGLNNYCDNVRAWAQSIQDVLKASGNDGPA